MRVVLFGKDGQLGWELQRSLAPLGEVVALGRKGHDGLCGDLTDSDGIARTLAQLAPDVIVVAAAYTAVDKAEVESESAYAVNAQVLAVMAQFAEQRGAWLMHYSTDYVFNGEGSLPWLETDCTAPLNVYGASKLAGEAAIIASGCQYLIFRTSWVYAARGNNFAKTMLRLGRERDSLSVVEDQWGAPTGAELLADASVQALCQAMKKPALGGLYHLAASGETSWHGYAQFVLAQARSAGEAIKVAPDAVLPVASSAFPTPAQRPKNSRLNTTKFQQAFGLCLPHWQQGVQRMLIEVLEA